MSTIVKKKPQPATFTVILDGTVPNSMTQFIKKNHSRAIERCFEG